MGQDDLERLFSKFQADLQPEKKKQTNIPPSEDDTVGAVLYSGRCELQLLRDAQRISMAK